MSKTNCEGCIFAIYDGNYQTGCYAGMPDKFDEKKIERREIEGTDGYHYMEVDAVCRMKRGEKWFQVLKPKDSWEAVKMASRDNQIHQSFIIYLRPERTYSQEEIVKTLRSIGNQSIKAREVILIERENHKTSSSVLSDSGLKWRRVTVYEDKPMDVLIWEQLGKIDAYFYTLVEPGFELPEDFTEKLDNYFNEEFKQFQLLESADNSYNGITCYIPTHYMYGTYEGIKTCCTEQNCNHMVKKVDEVYPQWNSLKLPQ